MYSNLLQEIVIEVDDGKKNSFFYADLKKPEHFAAIFYSLKLFQAIFYVFSFFYFNRGRVSGFHSVYTMLLDSITLLQLHEQEQGHPYKYPTRGNQYYGGIWLVKKYFHPSPCLVSSVAACTGSSKTSQERPRIFFTTVISHGSNHWSWKEPMSENVELSTFFDKTKI